ncbi:glycine--tRNA ligase subunit beta [Anaerovibrio lipolyticus]|uniref:glycine--tRNA ligase subunit beta n=1 Tax=Anaerovibrio lipolyticus TaxID=82374 RepID=UPI001F3909FF|nr:glycine--tRNA ligase subunit beta [Anaerovibrio lipolyticus]MCF2601256.1 glycine--tRNA ligase subunit beta [Anaerovibrio lipolyticus]
MSKTLLLEIGTEEVPAHVMPGILSQLKENAAKTFEELRIEYKNIKTLGTPRRSALLVEGLAERQADLSKENRGPAVNIAFDADGNPTKAAQGFARGQGVKPEELVTKDGYVYAMVHEKGGQTVDLLGDTLKGLVDGLNFPNNMHWADLDYKFIRPLRWLVALYGQDVIDFEVANVKSGRTSRGHRFLSEGDFEIANAEDYVEACRKASIIVDQNERCEMIRQQIAEVAAANGGQAEVNEDLLEEVLYLVEYPTALCGKFDEKYLALPAEAVITPMRDHQRYFPVLKDGQLLPLFITIRNGGKEHLETVQHGNERVLRARLEDAQFFFDEDRKKTLEQHGEKLKTVVFQDGLGTIYDKALRLEVLAGYIADAIGANEQDKKDAVRAAKLAKADLVTGMVTEFTELQGVMGREYALLDGETKAVAQAIDEHYMPRFAGDSQPASVAGRIVSLADKIDTIVGTFSRGLIPTGSQDPFALRRQALGIVNMLKEAQYHISLSQLVAKAMELLNIADAGQQAKLQNDVADFMKLRLKNVLADAGIRYDVVDAVFVTVDDIYGVFLRAQAVNEAVKQDMEKTIQAFVRTGNIARKAEDVQAAVETDLLAEQVEKDLCKAYEAAASKVEREIEAQDYAGAIATLSQLAAPIDAFFDGVMVMDKDEKIKNNRLGLLKLVDNLICQVADFSKIVLA